ncbi:rRNA methyltransferase [Serinibacter arcticus]|uniref:rRNA methyltransferase n=1 Tax=Serinibacter arcticus TaxID=1655435 RepID=A0A2U1ZV86_9MICO|nr:small ribosomal subunit Rsm22 family protein [Serinibacter arcticus]PWD50889.1 rRNA methyltransferase [Serinibacter arcticus]
MPASSSMPATLRRAIDDDLAALRTGGPGTTGRTEASARRLSARYLADHPADSPIVATSDDAAAYLTTRMPATFAAVDFALAQLLDAVPGLDPHSVLDLGSGTGAATWAAWATFDSLERADLVDYSRPMLEAATRLLTTAELTVSTTLADTAGRPAGAADAASSPTHDLAVAAFVLSELTELQQDAVVDRLAGAARQAVLVVEPGTPAGHRRILRVRDRLIAAGWRIAAPCPHELTCPVLAREGDWCHAAVRLERTRAHRQAKGGERGYEDEKLAYVAAVPPARDGAGLAVDRPTARVLRHPQTQSGHIRLELCTTDGEHAQLGVTKRDRDAFRAARKVEWGEAWRPERAAAEREAW